VSEAVERGEEVRSFWCNGGIEAEGALAELAAGDDLGVEVVRESEALAHADLSSWANQCFPDFGGRWPVAGGRFQGVVPRLALRARSG
jgi:hypothetical protein